jgi:hypothetical protein
MSGHILRMIFGAIWANKRCHSRAGPGSNGDGLLSTIRPVPEAHDTFVYDPGNPVRSLGGSSCCTKGAMSGSVDQTPIERRPDVLVYNSAILKRGVEIVGPISLHLGVSSTAKDTDFVAHLDDVGPDGKAYNLQEGILRLRYRTGLDRKLWMEAGKVYDIDLDLGATANWFAPGHRIRVTIASSSFPAFDRNLNTGGDNYNESHWVPWRKIPSCTPAATHRFCLCRLSKTGTERASTALSSSLAIIAMELGYPTLRHVSSSPWSQPPSIGSIVHLRLLVRFLLAGATSGLGPSYRHAGRYRQLRCPG